MSPIPNIKKISQTVRNGKVRYAVKHIEFLKMVKVKRSV